VLDVLTARTSSSSDVQHYLLAHVALTGGLFAALDPKSYSSEYQ
jgi:hypothetical protein